MGILVDKMKPGDSSTSKTEILKRKNCSVYFLDHVTISKNYWNRSNEDIIYHCCPFADPFLWVHNQNRHFQQIYNGNSKTSNKTPSMDYMSVSSGKLIPKAKSLQWPPFRIGQSRDSRKETRDITCSLIWDIIWQLLLRTEENNEKENNKKTYQDIRSFGLTFEPMNKEGELTTWPWHLIMYLY